MTLKVNPSISIILFYTMSNQEQHGRLASLALQPVFLYKFVTKPQRISMKHLSFLETPFSRQKHAAGIF